jgi:hypothetical protein
LNPSRSNGRRAKQPRGAVTGVGVVQQRAQSDLTRLRLAARGIPADDRIRHGAELQPCFRFGDRGITSASSAGRALCHVRREVARYERTTGLEIDGCELSV